ncbi:MAG TPA: Flp pilus assembly protein CpaB [Candidatus Aveggerthella excrementigallinarum]|nr:Flp pilus assembly protein CpaB [Candidatus Aveggerthella excrementigallinarum]
MRSRRTTIAGIACGLVCALSVFAYTQSVNDQAEQARADMLASYGGEQVEVCVATRDLAAGEIVPSDAVAMRSWIADFLPQETARSAEDVVGKQLTSPVLAGEPVSLQRFEGEADALDVPEGMAALSVPAGDVQSVGGSLSAGSRVDVYTTGSSSTSLLLSGALVLATSAGDGSSISSSSWVTLAVNPDRVQELVDASQRTELYFAVSVAVGEEGAS